MLVGPTVQHSRMQSAIRLAILLGLRLLAILLPPAQACCNSLDLFTINELGSFSLINSKRPASAGRFCFWEIDFTGSGD